MKTHSKPRVEPQAERSREVVTSRNSMKSKPNRIAPTTEFGESLKTLLGKTAIAREVSEEELFAASAHQLIKNRYGDQTAEDFKSAFRLNMADKPENEKHASAERSANEALKFFVRSSLMTKDEVKSIRDVAFEVAQLDDDRSKLWDNWGDSRAVTSVKRGEVLVQKRLDEVGSTQAGSSGAGGAIAKTRMVGYEKEKPRTEASRKGASRRGTPKIAQEA